MSRREILLARIGAQRIALRAEGVDRIASALAETNAGWVLSSILGAVRRAARGLVAEIAGEERVLAVDTIESISAMQEESIHPLPGLARDTLGTRCVEGLVSIGEELIWLIDLRNFLQENTAPAERPQE